MLFSSVFSNVASILMYRRLGVIKQGIEKLPNRDRYWVLWDVQLAYSAFSTTQGWHFSQESGVHPHQNLTNFGTSLLDGINRDMQWWHRAVVESRDLLKLAATCSHIDLGSCHSLHHDPSGFLSPHSWTKRYIQALVQLFSVRILLAFTTSTEVEKWQARLSKQRMGASHEGMATFYSCWHFVSQNTTTFLISMIFIRKNLFCRSFGVWYWPLKSLLCIMHEHGQADIRLLTSA